MKKIQIALLVALVAPMSLFSQTTLTPTADTYVAKGYGTEITGNEVRGADKMISSYRNPATKNVWWSIIYLKFDLKGIASVSNVKLKLYGKAEQARGLDVYTTALTNWSEETLSFNNADAEVGAISANPVATLDIVETTTAQYYEWDVTEAVLAAIKKGESAISFRVQDRYAVKNEKGAGVLIQFQSKESPYGKKPQLVIQTK